jgi:uncharacterized membrane protein
MTELAALITPIIAAVAYSLIIYAKKHTNPNNPQEFEPIKFISTAVLGTVLGVVSVYMQIPITQANFEQMFLLYGGSVILIESILKSIWRVTLGRQPEPLYE